MRKTLEENKVRENSQVWRVINKFGGMHNFLEALKNIGRPRAYITVRVWSYPRSKKRPGGVIPTGAWPDILAAARNEGILLSDKDFDPRPSK